MDWFDASENHYFIEGVGYIQFCKINDDKLLSACEKCCVKGSERCCSVKCCAHERKDACNGYFVKVPKKRIGAVLRVLKFFGL